MKALLFIFLAGMFFATPILGEARIGVGVGTGKIQLEENLKAGGIYDLPPITIFNTGDEPSVYSVGIQYHANQPEIRPDRSWFSFSPETFELGPGEARPVQVTLTIPLKTEPGDYFAYLEGQPVYAESSGGTARIGIAAAAKLYFTVAPANIFEAIYYRLLSFWKAWTPWTYIVLAIIAGAFILVLIRRFFSFNVGLRGSSKRDRIEEYNGDDEEEEVIIVRRPKKSTKTARNTSARKTITKRRKKNE